MLISAIITEADIIVPNEVSVQDKVIVLTALNQDFFNVVKIPRIATFIPIKDQTNYSLPTDVRLKNIDLVMCGVIKYKELLPSATNPMENTFTFDDSVYTLSLRPAPYQAGLQALVRYNRIATSIFSSTNLNVSPDFPEEYHYSLVLGLAAYLAQTQDDAIKASNYENQYKAMWNVSAQNYAKEVTK